MVEDTVTDKINGSPTLVKKGTEFIFALIATAIVDEPGQRPAGTD